MIWVSVKFDLRRVGWVAMGLWRVEVWRFLHKERERESACVCVGGFFFLIVGGKMKRGGEGNDKTTEGN